MLNTKTHLVKECLSQDPDRDPAIDDYCLIYYGAGINIHLRELLRIPSPSIEDLIEERNYEPTCFW
jgi:hypothetical protein